MKMNCNKSGWLTVGALLFALACSPALAFGQQPANPQDNTADRNGGSQLLLAMASPAPVSTNTAPAPPPPGSSFSWTGLYVGANFGSGSGNADTFVNPLPSAATFVNLAPTTLHPNPSGVVGGGTVGFNWQRGWLLVGAEADLGGSGITGTQRVAPIIQNNGTPFPGAGFLTAHQELAWFGTVRARVGIAVSQIVVYGTGGTIFGNVKSSADTDFRPVGTEHYPASLENTKNGSIAGGGVELALTRHWSVKGEYLHYDMGSEAIVANPAIPLPPFQISYTWQVRGNIGRGGVNFRF
jgi:outer membrane immunogenic protein